MAKDVRDVDQINRWIQAKQRNEQEMLRRLYHLFGSDRARGRIADVLMPAVAAMWLEDRLHWEEHHCASPIVSAVMQGEYDLPVWQACTRDRQSLISAQGRLLRMWEMLRARDPAVTAAHLSELTRVIGAWLEKGGGFATQHMYQTLQQAAPAQMARAGLPALQHTAGSELPQGTSFGVPDINKAFRVGEAWKSEFRQRDRLEHEIEDHVRQAWVRPAFEKRAGMEMKRADEDDLCKKLDHLFGLLVGATISGTTADVAIILEGLGAPRGLHAGYYLFPAATMAAALHHTLLEVAMPLVLLGVIDHYSIGFYRTLRPKGGLPEELLPADDLLRQGEEDQRNRHLVIWYDPDGAVAGGVLWEPGDYELAKDTLYDGRAMLERAPELPRKLTQKQVVTLVRDVSPLLFERLPVSLKRVMYN